MAAGRRDRDALSLFADELKAHRDARGWTQADLAAKITYSESLIAQVETCRRAPSKDLAKALDKVFMTPGFTEETPDSPGSPGTFGRLAAKLRNLPFPASFRSFAPYEAEAVALHVFEHSLIPGLLQTEAYARAVLATRPNTAEDEIGNLVAGRLARHAVLWRDDPPAPILWALIDEGVLYRPVAPTDVMHDQLRHLAEASVRPNITVQVVPYSAGGHTGLLGACTIADLDGSPSIVNLEDIADGRVTDDAATVSQVTLRFNSLRSEALPKGASRELIVRVAEERWQGSAP
ncbi:MAG: helix-turn-helix transcriptional regulator [Streptosporangiaceae bacterium]|nr:helix-turn-helix transcriptional regulator [Streptosporangiaceae bacterium]